MKHLVLAMVAMATMCTPAAAQNRVKYLSTSSNTLNIQLLQDAGQTVQLNRYLFAGYNTLCLPTTLTAAQLAEAARDVRVERLAGIRQEGSTLCLYFLDCTADGIQAGMPYLVYSPTAQSLRVKNTDVMSVSTELNPVTMSDAEGNRIVFDGSWERIQKDGRYGIPAQQNVYPLESVLVRTEADKAFLPTRCGFTWVQQSATATDLQIKHIGSLAEMGITGISALTDGDALVDVYDLKGHAVKKQVKASEALKNLGRGIYVVGGEKVVVQ